jgi:hypothetical protein
MSILYVGEGEPPPTLSLQCRKRQCDDLETDCTKTRRRQWTNLLATAKSVIKSKAAIARNGFLWTLNICTMDRDFDDRKIQK